MSKSLARGLQIITLLGKRGLGMRLSDISQELGLAKSTTFRLLETLEQEGFVSQDGDRGSYRSSLKLLSISGNIIDNLGLNESVTPLLSELAHVSQETIHMAMLRQNEAVYVEKVDSPNSIRMYSQIGASILLHSTAMGKAILAHLPDDRLQEILAEEGLLSRTENTITNTKVLLTTLDSVRSKGFAIDEQENEVGVRCIGAPVFIRNNQVVGAISISAPTFRVDQEQLCSWSPQLIKCARQVTTILQRK